MNHDRKERTRPCEICGNDIPVEAGRCPFCESPQSLPEPKLHRSAVRVLDLEYGKPDARTALQRLRSELQACRQQGVRVLKVVHGYGSTGKGGVIKAAVQREVAALKRQGLVREAVPGEEYDEFNSSSRELRDGFPELKQSFRSDRLNQGITLFRLA